MAGKVVYSFQSVSWRGKNHRKTHSGTKDFAGAISLCCPLAQTFVHLWQPARYQHSLPNLLTPPHTMLQQICPFQSCLPQYWGYHGSPPPEDQHKPCQQHITPPTHFALHKTLTHLVKIVHSTHAGFADPPRLIPVPWHALC